MKNNTEIAYICESCSAEINGNDVFWVDGEPYCIDCVSWCDYHEDYCISDDLTYINELDMFVCESCKANAKHDAEVIKAEANVLRLEDKYYGAKEALMEAIKEFCWASKALSNAIAELNELNADMTVEWEVN